MPIRFDVRYRWSGEVAFTAEIYCAEDAPRSLKLGLAVRWGIETRADLTRADLTRADLTRADLSDVGNDIFDILLRSIPEVPALLAALRSGKIDGATYSGKCACLCGTIAKTRGIDHDELGFADVDRPAERWFFGIKPGDTPATSQIAKITESWIEEFLSFGTPQPVKVETGARVCRC